MCCEVRLDRAASSDLSPGTDVCAVGGEPERFSRLAARRQPGSAAAQRRTGCGADSRDPRRVKCAYGSPRMLDELARTWLSGGQSACGGLMGEHDIRARHKRRFK